MINIIYIQASTPIEPLLRDTLLVLLPLRAALDHLSSGSVALTLLAEHLPSCRLFSLLQTFIRLQILDSLLNIFS